MPLAVQGLRELDLAFTAAGKETRAVLKKAEAAVAEPVRVEAEQLAVQTISGLRRARGIPVWSLMRIGVTRTSVYVAPRKRRGRPNLRRPNLAPLLMGKAMEPAVEHHAAATEVAFAHAMDVMADHFNRGIKIG